MMKHYRTLFLTSLILFFGFKNAKAQDDLSLSAALELALKQNFDIQIAQKNVEINEIQNSWGQAGLYPTINFNVAQNNSISDQSNNPQMLIQGNVISNNVQFTPNLNWVLFNGFRVKANKSKLEQLQYQSEGNAALIIENTIQGIVLAYYNANLQQEKLDLLKNVINLSREKYLHEKEKADFGFGTSFDLLQFESAYLTDSSSIVMQEIAVKNTIKNLNLLMAEDVNKEWNLTDKLMPDHPMYDMTNLKNKMLANNTNIKNQVINLEVMKHDITLAKTSMYPVLSLNAGGNFNFNRLAVQDYPVPGQTGVLTYPTSAYFANFTLNFKIFDGGKVRRAIQAVKIQDDISNFNLDKLKLQLTQELANHYDIYNARVAVFEIAKKAFNVAERNFEYAKIKQEGGLINSFDVRNIELAYLQAGITLFESLYNIEESKTNLTRLTGGLVSEE